MEKIIKISPHYLRLIYVLVGSTLLMMLSREVSAQRLLVENQYFVNPWVYNPARIAESNYTEIGLSYKQQWVGLEGAPAIARLSVQSPLNKSLRLGGYLWYQSEGPFQQVEGEAVLAYRLALGQREDHALKFGMSLGFGNRTVNLDKFDDPSDPGLSILPLSSSYLQGSFGFFYQLSGLELGFSVPRLVQETYTGEDGFTSPSFSTPDYYIVSLGYNWELPTQGIRLEPQVRYHRDQAISAGQWEGNLTAYYRDWVWAGGAYRQDYGTSAYAGVAPTKRLGISYIYSFSSLGSQISNASHEIVLQIKLGKGNKKQEEPAEEIILDEEPEGFTQIEEEELPTEPKQEQLKVDQVDSSQNEVAITVVSDPEPTPEVVPMDSLKKNERLRVRDLQGNNFQLDPGYYLICGAFTSRTNAQRYQKTLNDKGLLATIIMVPSRGYYYVYTGYSKDRNTAEIKRQSLYKRMGFQKTWILTIAP